MVFILEKIFLNRILIANSILVLMGFILLNNTNLDMISTIFFLFSCLIMNCFALSKKSNSISFMLWFFLFGGFLVYPTIYLYLGQNFFIENYIWYGTSTFLALGVTCLFNINFFPNDYEKTFFNVVPDTKALKIFKLFVFLTIIFMSYINFENLYYFRGINSSIELNKYLVMAFKFSFLLFIPLVSCWILHNSYKENIISSLMIFFVINILIISCYGSRFGILLLIFFLYDILRRNIKINNLVIFSIFALMIISLNIVSSKRSDLFNANKLTSPSSSPYSSNSFILGSLKPGVIFDGFYFKIKITEKSKVEGIPSNAYLQYNEENILISHYFLAFENFLVRFLGADGVYYVQNKIKNLNSDELVVLKQKILTEKRVKNKLSYYDNLMMPDNTKLQMQEKQNEGLSISNLPGGVGFLSIFLSPVGLFFGLSLIFLIMHFIEYMTNIIFKNCWAFGFIISLVLVTRFINFGIYFADSYKIILSLSVSVSIFYIIHYFRIPLNKYFFKL